MAFPITTAADKIASLYVGYFGRAADPDGLNYWVSQLNGGMSLAAIANSFAVQPEATTLYAFLAAPNVGNVDAFIKAIYQDLFNRDPDAAGLAYWRAQLTQFGTPPGQMVLNIISGATGSDKTIIENKTHVAKDYAIAFVDGNVHYVGIDNQAAATSLITGVTADPATVAAAELQIAAIVHQEQTNPANIQLSANLATVLSGGGVDITIQADPSQAGKAFSYTITGVNASEIKDGQLSGNVVLGSNSKATLHIDTVVTAASLNTPNETLKVTMGPVSTSVVLQEGTQTVTAPGTVNEGSSFNFSVSTTNIAPGSAQGLVETYTITGPGIVQIPVAERSGTVTLDSNGNATVTIHTLATVFNSAIANPTVTVTVGNNTPVNVTIVETAVEQVVASSAAIVQGNTVTFTVSVSGVAGTAVAGTVQSWTLTGTALAEVVGALSGTVTLDSAGSAVVTVQTNAAFNGGPNPLNLTFNLFGNDGVSPSSLLATSTVTVNQLVNPFILTTGTDAGPAFTGNSAGGNQYFALANTLGSTLGQNDNLNGNSNVPGQPNTLFLNTSGLVIAPINAFTTHDIQVFDINAGAVNGGNGTSVDMSQAFGVTTLISNNSSQSLTLLNVQAPLAAKLTNPSDLGNPVNLSIQYTAAAALATSAQAGGQQLTLDPTVSPITGLPNSKFWVNVPNMTITSTGGGVNGLVSVNGPTGALPATALTSVTMNGNTPFVLGAPGSGIPGMAFTGGTNTLNLSALSAIFYNIGDPGTAAAITAAGNLTINGGAGFNRGDGLGPVAMESFYSPASYNPFYSGSNQLGGAGAGLARATILETGGNLTVNVDGGSFYGQQIVNSFAGGSVTINGAGVGAGGGFIGGLAGENSATIVTNGGAVTVQGLRGGLGNTFFNPGGAVNPGSMIVTNSSGAGGGNITITNVEGGVNEQISSGTGRTNINQAGTGSNNTFDFSRVLGALPQTGFHKNLGAGAADNYVGGNGVDTLFIDPSINNNTSASGEGNASGIDNLILQSPSGTTWSPTAAPNVGGGTPNGSFGLANLGNPTNVYIGGNGNTVGGSNFAGPVQLANLALTNATFTGAKSGENFFVDTQSTGALSGQIFGFDFGNTGGNTLNLTLQGPSAAQTLTVRDFATNNVNNNPVTRFNFTSNAGNNANLTTLVLDTLAGLTRLDLFGTNAMTLTGSTGGGGTVTEVHGGNSNININALAGGAGNYLNMTNVGTNTITLGNGSDKVTINGGSVGNNWLVNTGAVPGGGTAGDSGNSTFILNPNFGQTYTVNSGGGSDDYTVGNGGGIVHLAAGAGGDLFRFNMAGANPGLNSAQFVDGGTGIDGIVLFGGAVNENDSLFGHVTSVENFTVAAGFNNSLLLNFFANASGLTDIFTSGGGSSNVFREGTGFTNPLHYHIADGDTRDAIIVSPVSGPITVTVSATEFNLAFMTGLNTLANDPGTGLPTKSGIFANGSVTNTLELVADGGTANLFGNGTFGVNNMQKVVGVDNGGADLTVFLVNAPNLGTQVNSINLSNVVGNTTVWGQASTTHLDIIGGSGQFSTLIGGSAADTITARAYGNGVVGNWIWGMGGADTLTGAAGDPGPQTGGPTTFIYNTLAELKGGDTITNFHWQTDSFFINPTILQPQSNGNIFYAGFGATYADVLQLMVGGGTGAGGPVYTVYQVDTGMMWFDVNNDGLLNASDAQLHVTFGSPPAPAGQIWFQTAAEFNAWSPNSGLFFNGANVVVNALNNVDVPAGTTLAFGEVLFGGPGINDTQTLGDGANIEDGNIGINTAAAFEHLVFDGATGDVSVAQWNWFNNTPGNSITSNVGGTTVIFSDGWDPIETTFTTNNNIPNYDLHLLSNASNVTVANGAPPGLIIGSNKGDTFNIRPFDAENNWVQIKAGTGNDTLKFTTATSAGVSATATIDPTGGGNVQVSGIENLVLGGASGTNTVVFQNGGSFKNVTGTALVDNITTGSLVAGGTITTDGGADKVTLSSNLAGTSIDLGTGNDTLQSAVGGAITTKLDGGANFDTLALINGDDISGAVVVNFEALNLANNATVKMTVPQWGAFSSVTGAAGLEKIVFVGAGGGIDTNSDVESYDLSGLTSASTVNIALFQNGGGAIVGSTHGDSFVSTIGDIDGTNAIKILGGSGNDSLTLTTSGTLILDGAANGAGRALVSGVENLFLDSSFIFSNTITFANGTAFKNVTGGTNSDTINTGVGGMVAGGLISTDGGNDTVNMQENLLKTNVDLGSGNDTLNFSGPDGSVINATWDGGANTDTLILTSTADISGATVINFENLTLANNKNATMTTAQYAQFTGTVTGTGTNQITFLGAGGTFTTAPQIEVYDLTATTSDNTITVGNLSAKQTILGSFTQNDTVITSVANLANLIFNGFGDKFAGVLPNWPTNNGDTLKLSTTGAVGALVLGDGGTGGTLDNVETFDASANTGGFANLSFAAGTGLKYVITGSGADVINTANLAAASYWVSTDGGSDTVTAAITNNLAGIDLGAQNDTLNLTTSGTLAANTRLLGGAGTDTLAATLTATSSWGANNVQSFETVGITGDFAFSWTTADGDIDSATAITFNTAITNKAITVNASAESDQNITIGLTTDAAGTTTLKTGGGNADTFNIVLTGNVANDKMQLDGGAGTADALNVSGNFNWTSNGGDIVKLEQIKWSGNGAVNATFANADIDNDTTMTVVNVTNKAVTIDASAESSSKLTMNVTSDIGQKVTLKGGTANDTFNVTPTGDVNNDDLQLNGGGGADILNLLGSKKITSNGGDISLIETVNVGASIGEFKWTTADGDMTSGVNQTLHFASAFNDKITLDATSSNDANWSIDYTAVGKDVVIKTDAGNDVVDITLGATNGINDNKDVNLDGGNDQIIVHLNGFNDNFTPTGKFGTGVETFTFDGTAATNTSGLKLTLSDGAQDVLNTIDFHGVTNGVTLDTNDFNNTALTVRGSLGNDVLSFKKVTTDAFSQTVNLTDGGVDTVQVSQGTGAVGADKFVTISGFTAGAGGDIFDIMKADNGAATVTMTAGVIAPGAILNLAATNATAGLMLAGNGIAPGEINSKIFGAVTDTSDGGAVELAVINSQIITNGTANQLGIVALDNGTSTGIYQLTSNVATGTQLTLASQFTVKLIGVLDNVSDVGTLQPNNIV